MYSEISAIDLESYIQSWPLELIDVREVEEWRQIRIPSAKLIPLSSIEFRLHEIDFTRPVFVFCRSGARSAKVCQWLESQGKEATNVAGSIRELYKIGSPLLEITPEFTPEYLS